MLWFGDGGFGGTWNEQHGACRFACAFHLVQRALHPPRCTSSLHFKKRALNEQFWDQELTCTLPVRFRLRDWYASRRAVCSDGTPLSKMTGTVLGLEYDCLQTLEKSLCLPDTLVSYDMARSVLFPFPSSSPGTCTPPAALH